MKILGLSAYYHDSSAAIMVDGIVIAAAQEERFTRLKHDNSFPINACRFCLDYCHVDLQDLDAIVFYEKPFLKFERIITSYIQSFPKSYKMFLNTIPIWLKEKLNMRTNIQKQLEKHFGFKPKNVEFVEHHLSHAAFAYCASGFKETDILVVDAVGEWATTSIMHAKDSQIDVVFEQQYPDSIGLLYSAFTQFLGFRVNSDEYKVMGLAPYGDIDSEETNNYIRLIMENIVEYDTNGLIRLNLSYFSFQYGDRMIDSKKWELLFGLQVREPESVISQSYKNLALAIQTITEDILMNLVSKITLHSKSDNLCITGGVALNCAANGTLLSKTKNKNLFIPFAPGDCGCSIGAAIACGLLNDEKISSTISPYLGPEYDKKEILDILRKSSLKYEVYQTEDELCEETAKLLKSGKIIGWFQGRMEMEPRALGNRSILADARVDNMKDLVNSKIKFRESFRPFAPSVIEHVSNQLFNNDIKSPYMMFTFGVTDNSIPSVTHVDNTARIQTVSKSDNRLFYKLINHFYKLTGCPVLLNTSFNVMGEPIVCSPLDAVNTFVKSGLDYLVINQYIVYKGNGFY